MRIRILPFDYLNSALLLAGSIGRQGRINSSPKSGGGTWRRRKTLEGKHGIAGGKTGDRHRDSADGAGRDASGFALQLNIPIKVVAPSLWGCPESNSDMQHGRNPFRLSRPTDQPHACFLRRAASLFMVAIEAAGNDIIPGFSAAFYYWNDMVKREIFCRAFFAAVLACVSVSGVNIRPAEFYVVETLSYLYILEKSEDTGHLDGKTDASNLAVIFG
jgi:hypothetical protein